MPKRQVRSHRALTPLCQASQMAQPGYGQSSLQELGIGSQRNAYHTGFRGFLKGISGQPGS